MESLEAVLQLSSSGGGRCIDGDGSDLFVIYPRAAPTVQINKTNITYGHEHGHFFSNANLPRKMASNQKKLKANLL